MQSLCLVSGYCLRLQNKMSVKQFLMTVGQISGCHRRPDRSFFFRGRQFPVCARCTGVFIGECISICSFRLIHVPLTLPLLFCACMFLDWFIQYMGWKESTNWRRLITGLLGGYGYFTLVLKGVVALKELMF